MLMLSDIYLLRHCNWCNPLMDNRIDVKNCVCWRYIHLKEFLSTPYVCKSLCPGGTKLQKANFSIKVTVKVIDLGVIWKGIISGICIPNIKSFSLAAQCLQLKLKLTTDKTNIQDKKYVSDYLIQGIKKCNTGEHYLFSKSKVTIAGMKIQPMPITSVRRSWPMQINSDLWKVMCLWWEEEAYWLSRREIACDIGQGHRQMWGYMGMWWPMLYIALVLNLVTH